MQGAQTHRRSGDARREEVG